MDLFFIFNRMAAGDRRGGVAILWAWFFTDHHVAVRNENLMQLTPLALLLVYFLPRLAWKHRGGKWAVCLSAAMAGLSILGVALKLLPHFVQTNGDIIALVMPVQMALAWIIWQMAAKTSASAAPIEASGMKGRRAAV